MPGDSVLKKPPQTFVPDLWAKDIYKTLAHKSAIQQSITESLAPWSNNPWKVWFAWFPVKITVVTNVIEIHDEITFEGYSKWKWLTHVTRRRIRRYIDWRQFWRRPSRSYEYGPATNALTQPKVSLGRGLF